MQDSLRVAQDRRPSCIVLAFGSVEQSSYPGLVYLVLLCSIIFIIGFHLLHLVPFHHHQRCANPQDLKSKPAAQTLWTLSSMVAVLTSTATFHVFMNTARCALIEDHVVASHEMQQRYHECLSNMQERICEKKSRAANHHELSSLYPLLETCSCYVKLPPRIKDLAFLCCSESLVLTTAQSKSPSHIAML